MTLSSTSRRLSGVILVSLLVLGGCAEKSDYFKTVNKGTGQQPQDTCGASTYAYLIGKPASVLDGIVIPEPKRVIPAGAAVTMDYNPERLNIGLDVSDTIARLSCG